MELPYIFITAVVAEWLRRWIRNLLGSPRTGSNPVHSDHFCNALIMVIIFILRVLKSSYGNIIMLTYYNNSCGGRVVKAMDLKSIGVSPRRFESCSQRLFFINSFRDI